MKKTQLRKILAIFLLMLAVGNITIPMVAEASNANTASYSVRKVPSKKDEIDPQASYFDLKLAPGQKKTIQTVIRNTGGGGDITVLSNVFTTFTNANGEIDYTQQAEEYDSSLKIKMSDIAEVHASDIKAVIPAGKEKTVSLDIEVPADAPEGVILGSWHFAEEETGEQTETGEGVTIDSKYAYALAIKITVQKEIDKPNMELKGITAGLVNYRKAFLAELQNDRPALLTKVRIEGSVSEKGKTEVLYSHTMPSVAFAPNSNFRFPVFLGGDQMKAGDYTYRIKAITDDPKAGFTGQQWEWSMDFTVLPEDANRVNAEAINDPQPEKTWLDYLLDYWWIIALIVGLLLFLWFLLWRRRKKKREADKDRDKERLKELLESGEISELLRR